MPHIANLPIGPEFTADHSQFRLPPTDLKRPEIISSPMYEFLLCQFNRRSVTNVTPAVWDQITTLPCLQVISTVHPRARARTDLATRLAALPHHILQHAGPHRTLPMAKTRDIRIQKTRGTHIQKIHGIRIQRQVSGYTIWSPMATLPLQRLITKIRILATTAKIMRAIAHPHIPEGGMIILHIYGRSIQARQHLYSPVQLPTACSRIRDSTPRLRCRTHRLRIPMPRMLIGRHEFFGKHGLPLMILSTDNFPPVSLLVLFPLYNMSIFCAIPLHHCSSFYIMRRTLPVAC